MPGGTQRFRHPLGMTGGGLAVLVAGLIWIGPGGITLGSSAPAMPHHTAGAPRSWLQGATLLTVYGKAFDTAPILGQLGAARSFSDLSRRTASARIEIRRLTGRPQVRMAVHLIYGLAVPCRSADDSCLLYSEDAGIDVLHDYILPAAQRGWLVILDDQLGRSNPAREIKRLIARGYLAHDNVEVAFDPEFRTRAGQSSPGAPPGYVTARELNHAQRLIDRTAARAHLAHRKLLLVHQWTPTMIRHRRLLATKRRYVRPVIVMDGIGRTDEKAVTYTQLVQAKLVDRGVVPGIKLFPPNPYEPWAPADQPVLSWPQLLAKDPIAGVGGSRLIIDPPPRVVVLT